MFRVLGEHRLGYPTRVEMIHEARLCRDGQARVLLVFQIPTRRLDDLQYFLSAQVHLRRELRYHSLVEQLQCRPLDLH